MNVWEWANGTEIQEKSGITLPKITGTESENPVGDYFFYARRAPIANRGPCGIPRNAWGKSPYMVGEQQICTSSTCDCARCPLNPNVNK